MRALVVCLLGLYGWWVVALPRFSGVATAVVVGSGVIAMGVGGRERHAQPAAGGGSWVVLLVVASGWQAVAFLQHPRDEHPTISSLTNALLDTHPARAVAFVLWLAVAWRLGRR